jgi:hypothetical protein
VNWKKEPPNPRIDRYGGHRQLVSRMHNGVPSWTCVGCAFVWPVAEVPNERCTIDTHMEVKR